MTAKPHPTLFDLRSGQCRFPIGGPREPARYFCGKPADIPRPYCRECAQRAYKPISLGARARGRGS